MRKNDLVMPNPNLFGPVGTQWKPVAVMVLRLQGAHRMPKGYASGREAVELVESV